MIREEINSNIEEKFYGYSDYEVAKNLYYQCRFKKSLAKVEKNLENETNLENLQKLLLLKSKIYFEFGQREKSYNVLEETLNLLSYNKNADYNYTLGSIMYFKGDFELAKNCFQESLSMSLNDEIKFSSLLGLGNIFYSKGQVAEAKIFLKEASCFADNLDLDKELSLKFFRANLLMLEKPESMIAEEVLSEGFLAAQKNGWNYFSYRALYYLAKLEKNRGEQSKALGILKVLGLHLKSLDWRLLNSLVNTEFEKLNFQVTGKINIDPTKCVLMVGDQDKQEIDLSKWPKLFSILELLFIEKDFVSKERIAKLLWEDEKYAPRTHDPRIYDLMGRLKKRLELSRELAICIECKNGAYKLKV